GPLGVGTPRRQGGIARRRPGARLAPLTPKPRTSDEPLDRVRGRDHDGGVAGGHRSRQRTAARDPPLEQGDVLMSENATPICPECQDDKPTLDRRNFIRVVGGAAAAVTLGGVAGLRGARADDKPADAKKSPRPAEELIKELYTGLDADQKKMAVYDFDAKGDPNAVQGGLKRLGMYNASLGEKIGKVYTKPQQELVERILRAIASNEEGFTQLTRNGT